MLDRLTINRNLQAEPEFLKLARQIRLNYQNRDEHILFLEHEVEKQLLYIKQSLVTEEQRETYSRFREEFEKRKIQHLLSYEWWILFCYRLSILITPFEFRSNSTTDIKIIDSFVDKLLTNNLWLTHESFLNLLNDVDPFNKKDFFYAYTLRNLIKKFPDVIMIPSTDGDIPAHSFNQSLLYNVIPLGMINKGMYADGQFYYPDRFYRHDLSHAGNWFFSDNNYNFNTLQLFIEKILNKIDEDSDPRKKSQLDFMLFYMTHEFPLFFYIADIDNLRAWMLRRRNNSSFTLYDDCINNHWYGLLIKPYLSGIESVEKETKDYLDESISLIDAQIKEFFNTYSINSFMKKATKPRNYKIKEPLAEKEITEHWTYQNDIAKTMLTNIYGNNYPSSTFFHYIVKNDHAGPNYKKFCYNKVAIHSHLISKKNFFNNRKIAHSKIHKEEFKKITNKI